VGSPHDLYKTDAVDGSCGDPKSGRHDLVVMGVSQRLGETLSFGDVRALF
jgi:hypothetical protein